MNKNEFFNAKDAKSRKVKFILKTLRDFASFAFISFLILPVAHAQTPQPANSGTPLEITADGSLEWNRNDKLFIARENAMAKQGDSSIKAATLIAHYREANGKNMDIHKVEADQNVELVSKQSTAYGQKADYDLDKGVAIMTGDNLKLVSTDQTITARDKFEYWINAGKFSALGNARVEQRDAKGQITTLQSDKISAILKDDAQGKRTLDSLEANGNVIIKTPTETVTGQDGVYNARTKKAVLTGGVVINRGPNKLEGDRAEVDLNTNTSQLFGGPTTAAQTGGQVRGIFYPGTEKKGAGSIIPPPSIGVPLPSAGSKAAPQAGDPDESKPMLTVE